MECLTKAFGRLQVRIAKAEIENLVCTMESFESRSLFEHFANPRRAFNSILYFHSESHISASSYKNCAATIAKPTGAFKEIFLNLRNFATVSP
jgi:hypothetical protein